jgi:hypothetical protein
VILGIGHDEEADDVVCEEEYTGKSVRSRNLSGEGAGREKNLFILYDRNEKKRKQDGFADTFNRHQNM